MNGLLKCGLRLLRVLDAVAPCCMASLRDLCVCRCATSNKPPQPGVWCLPSQPILNTACRLKGSAMIISSRMISASGVAAISMGLDLLPPVRRSSGLYLLSIGFYLVMSGRRGTQGYVHRPSDQNETSKTNDALFGAHCFRDKGMP